MRPARNLWIGREEHEALEDLADEIIDRLESLGEPLE